MSKKVLASRTTLRALCAVLVLAALVAVPPAAVATSPATASDFDGTYAMAEYHTCAVASDGIAWCWGYNPFGELGNGSTGGWTYAPGQVVGVSRAVEVAVGSNHSCALLANGTVQCWGDNRDHELGNGTDNVSRLATSVVGISDGMHIASRGFETCVIHSDSTVSCWGDNFFGQLGNGTTNPTLVPVPVSGLAGVVDLAVGGAHSCAVTADGSVWCWGRNAHGELGDGSTTPRSAPVRVTGITTATRVAVGWQFSCAVLADGTVKCWGANDYKQLGNDTLQPSASPLAIAGVDGAVEIAAGQAHACATIDDGTVRCWGNNGLGELGVERGANRSTPVAPVGVTDSVALVASTTSRTCAILAAGSFTCWAPYDLPADDPTFAYGEPGVGNDDFAAAQSITGLPFADGFDASAAGLETAEPIPSCAGGAVEGSVWYRYKSPSARLLTVDSLGPRVAVYAGSSLGNLVEVGCGSSVDLEVVAAQSYWLQVFGDLGATSLSVHARAAAPNDDLANATTITDLPFTSEVDTTTATLEPGEPIPSCALDNPPYASIWYRYLSPVSQQLRVTWSGFWYPRIGVYEQSGAGQLVEMACNGSTDDPSDFFAEAGHEYFFLVRSHGESGLLTFNLSQVPITDTVAPSVQIDINPTIGTPGYTRSLDATYSLNAGDPHPSSGLTAMAISESPDGPWNWELLDEASRHWTLAGPDGVKHIYARVRDAAGNVSPVGVGSVVLDRVAPNGTVTINGGAQYTNGDVVTLAVPATDASPIEHIALSNDGVNWGTTWYEPTKTWTLAGNQGTNTVYVKWWDAAGNWSEVASDTILDSSAPVVTAPEPEFVQGSSVTGGLVVIRVEWTGQDAVSGIAGYQLNQRTDSGSWKNVPAGSAVATVVADDRSVDRTLSPGHAYTFRAKATDNATNGSAWAVGLRTSIKKFQESANRIHYQGKWTRTTAGSPWGGAARRSSVAGATASFTFTGRSFAWVSTLAPDRGRAEVYVNGILAGTVDLYSTTLRSRSIVWTGHWATSVTRTISIMVLGTAGRPKVDIDAIVTAQ